MCFRKAIRFTGVAAAVWLLTATSSATAITPQRTTYFTFGAAVRLADVVLPPGRYVFEIARPHTAANVVRVMDGRRSKVYLMAITRPVTRPSAWNLDASIVFREDDFRRPRGIAAWYPEGETTGRQFLH
jgi:hypothetical protein